MRLSRENIPLAAFKKAKETIESGLQVYVDEITEDRLKGTVDILYSLNPMPTKVDYVPPEGDDDCQFVVGKSRSTLVTASLREVPHLLVAGQTGGGKSTFLRQFITTLRLRNPSAQFTLIDLKGGLEFQIFEDVAGVQVLPDVDQASVLLKDLGAEFESRFYLLRQWQCKDIDAYNAKAAAGKAGSAPKRLNRMIVVIDEAAEMFLVNPLLDAKSVQLARRIVNKIAAQGRALGIHLVVATQRPDARSLDPQTKANLTGVLCFAMTNAVSSMTVLGCGRAKDLPSVPGRAVWKTAQAMIELQTPFLSVEGATKRLPKSPEGEGKVKVMEVQQPRPSLPAEGILDE